MRAIKFRSKCIDETTDNGKWIVGSLLQDDNGIFMIVCFADHHEQWYRVDPDTVGQFTGLTDAKGKEVYEGDILFMECDNGENIYNEVGIKDGCFGYIGEVTGKLIPFCNHDVTEIIAGNIHDNPELLKGGDHEN